MEKVFDLQRELVVEYNDGSGVAINNYDIDEMNSAFLPSQEDMDEYYKLVNKEHNHA